MSSGKAPKKRGRGRPPLPRGQVKTKIVPMRLKEEDVKLFSKAAKAHKQSLSEWMRSTLRDAAKGSTGESRT